MQQLTSSGTTGQPSLVPQDEPSWQRRVAALLTAFRDGIGAIRSYRAVVRADPTSPRARADLGAALAGWGDAAGAASELREAVRLDPTDVRSHNQLVMIVAVAFGNPTSSRALVEMALVESDREGADPS